MATELSRAPVARPVGDEPESTRIVWQVFGAPGLTVSLLTLMFALLLVATQIPQGVPISEIAATHSFSITRVVEGFGVNHVIVSWPMALLAVLLALNLIALVLRRWLEGRAAHPAELPLALEGARVRSGEAVFRGADQAQLGALLTRWFSDRHVRATEAGTFATRGAVREGILFAAVGALTVAIALIVQGAGESGRIVTHVAPPQGAAARDVSFARVDGGAAWEPASRRIEAVCQEGASGLTGPRACAITTASQDVTGALSPGQPVWLPGLRVTLAGIEPERDSIGVRFALKVAETGEATSMVAAPRRPYDITVTRGGQAVALGLSAVSGVDGPALALWGGERPWILAGVAQSAPDGPELVVRPLAAQMLTLDFSTTGHRVIGVVGGLILLLGVGLIVAPPHLVVRAVPGQGGALVVRVLSANRPARARDVQREITAALSGKE